MLNIRHKNTIIADSGYWIALGNKKDRYHEQAMAAFKQLSAVLVLTWPVITEVSYILQRDVGFQQQQAFIRAMKSDVCQIYPLTIEHFVRIETLMQQYQNLPMDLADASLVILAEFLGHGRIFSTDQRDFNTYRWKHHQPFENLLLTYSSR